MNKDKIKEAIGLFFPFGTEGFMNLFTEGRNNYFFNINWKEDYLANLIANQNKTRNVWFSPSLRREAMKNNARGTEGDCVYCPGTYVDIDIRNEIAHKADSLPQNLVEAMHLVEMSPIKPTLLINTGYGLQLWWLWTGDSPSARSP